MRWVSDDDGFAAALTGACDCVLIVHSFSETLDVFECFFFGGVREHAHTTECGTEGGTVDRDISVESRFEVHAVDHPFVVFDGNFFDFDAGGVLFRRTGPQGF